MATNQKVIESLLSIMMLSGRQGLALRGHRDDKVVWDEDHDSHNLGNFTKLVHFRAQTDDVLRTHLEGAPKNTCYTFKKSIDRYHQQEYFVLGL